ncbi:hypothetical protein [Pseudosulfitobacter sp. DSM 107133]|uniref:DUF6950 family protein n=1 Tax=Pseudosulfitobacter sp. DSM 107133 TaxID=2883100 RepID=UPI000DF2C9C0|nr:hypothetical protein [Pseudosulfitobacter sp. DSM 107133]UOA25894.1 hypothetical protein DSM107133_00583 [Pseudosulfitobacter sp. DSM 107133]
MTHGRRQDWHANLIQYLSEVSRRPFAEGQNDCALFLAGGVRAMTGVDYATLYRGRYTTIRGGLRILRKDGFNDHVELAKHHLKSKPVAVANAGDGAVIATDEGQALGIVQGAAVYVLRPAGLGLVPLTDAILALEV